MALIQIDVNEENEVKLSTLKVLKNLDSKADVINQLIAEYKLSESEKDAVKKILHNK